MKVYPVPGRAVRDPVTKHVLAEDGLEVSEHDIFWARRIRDEDVTTTAPEKAVTTETQNEAPAVAAPARDGGEA